ncbi:MAG: transcriptional regulator NrdR [Desulfomonilia bacterium]|jgi:transcriptional repressor NrdR|uniref:Transcriptional repressor NrdR n=1 Tax=anaerobic digester metagenome TaxID=1263854 RepID=A0A485LV72_9ZZZZ|nr:transcriptional regulator NrdR [Pseudomonadota bacterium]HON39549.1 transcriptional regulator NrdR [Deltaproteobacteria bacterium]HRS55723.1 transcriptional regulator NrdR [Desulfomonilia bacterium]HPD20802.1 transcriptional regulator NrdR [Deltaproteobacteria bacterium]HPX18381.1 transcriptional regulator NrdR [Deltaproteobacteria bacterium]
MRCPRCSGLEDRVIQSRISRDGSSIRRRRECIRCSYRFTTYEKVEESIPMVVKKDGRREAFDPNKVTAGIITACEKRPVSIEAIDAVKDSIIHDIQSKWDREVPSTYIGEKVMEALHRLDPVAYVRFASVYREFKDVKEFMEEIKGFDKGGS